MDPMGIIVENGLAFHETPRRKHTPRWHFADRKLLKKKQPRTNGPNERCHGGVMELQLLMPKKLPKHRRDMRSILYILCTFNILYVCIFACNWIYMGPYIYMYIYIYLYCTCMYIICLTYVWIPKYDVKTAICSFFLGQVDAAKQMPQIKGFCTTPFLMLRCRFGLGGALSTLSKMPYITMCQGAEWKFRDGNSKLLGGCCFFTECESCDSYGLSLKVHVFKIYSVSWFLTVFQWMMMFVDSWTAVAPNLVQLVPDSFCWEKRANRYSHVAFAYRLTL